MKTIPLIVLIMFSVLLSAQTITVKQDGTGDFTTIQAAVNNAQNGDTVLIWPGTYYENVDLLSKSITLAGRTITTGDESYKYNTIIDGNNSGSCILIKDNISHSEIYGLTLQHGSGYEGNGAGCGGFMGGGICILNYCECQVDNCIIKNNYAKVSGGGISCGYYCKLILKSTVVKHNHTGFVGGGIVIGYESHVIFDTINLNSVYLNYAAEGCDLSEPDGDLYIKLDTATVFHPDSYYFHSADYNGLVNNYTFNILHQKIVPVDSNLYVNPVTGNDSSSGLNPDEALKTIAFAYTKMIPDSSNRNTIFLANGIYSDTLNGEKFPLNTRAHVNVQGESRNGTILDGEYKSKLFFSRMDMGHLVISKMTLRRGSSKAPCQLGYLYGLMYFYCPNDSIVIDSVLFTEGWANPGTGELQLNYKSGKFFVKNCEFSNNIGVAALLHCGSFDTIYVSNCKFYSNKPYFDTVPEAVYGRAMEIRSKAVVVTNSLFVDNDYNAIIGLFPSENYIVNCTFTENAYGSDRSLLLDFNESHNYMYNCILYNNDTFNYNGDEITIGVENSEHVDTTKLFIRNSLVQDGEQTIAMTCSNPDECYYYYDTTNIDTDPLFYGGAEFPYNLSGKSPCIDAGTLELPQFILDNMPDTDLAGNPRIFNDKIDMGAYEWNPTVSTKEIPTTKQQIPRLTAAPNPFIAQTTISARWDKPARVNIEVYNFAGLLIKTLQHGQQPAGSCQIPWNGTDNSGNYLPAGVYVIVLRVDGKEVASVKVVKQ